MKFEREGLLESDPRMTQAAIRFMRGYLHRYFSDESMIADVTQSAMLELIVKLREWDGENTPDDMFRLISNCAKNALRRQLTKLRRRLVSFESQQHSNYGGEYDQTLAQREEIERVEQQLDEHEDRDKGMFIAKIQGYSSKEIADRFQTTEGAVRTATYRMRTRLRIGLSAEDKRRMLIDLAKQLKEEKEHPYARSSESS